MAQFLTTTGISARLEGIITGARTTLVLVSPYLQLSENLHERLIDADQRGVPVTVFYREDKLVAGERAKLNELREVELIPVRHLHAKCYLNETEAIITSMNMYEFSERSNREMGIAFDRDSDRALYDATVAEVESIRRAAERRQGGDAAALTRERARSPRPDDEGFCIRCGEPIPANPDRPLCSPCYRVWAEFENPDYPEQVCHLCGSPSETSMAKPLCGPCYRRG